MTMMKRADVSIGTCVRHPSQSGDRAMRIIRIEGELTKPNKCKVTLRQHSGPDKTVTLGALLQLYVKHGRYDGRWRKWLPDILRLYNQGMSPQEVHEALGPAPWGDGRYQDDELTPQMVRYIINRELGERSRWRPKKKEKKKVHRIALDSVIDLDQSTCTERKCGTCQFWDGPDNLRDGNEGTCNRLINHPSPFWAITLSARTISWQGAACSTWRKK